jgi:putative ABC transport system permease protein
MTTMTWSKLSLLAADPTVDPLNVWSTIPTEAKIFTAVAFVAAAVAVVLGKIPLRYNFRNLGVRWITTTCIVAAFTLVLALLTLMQALVNGMNKLTEASGRPGNVMILSDGSTDEVFSNLGFADIDDIANQPGVERDERGVPLCSKETYMIVVQPKKNPIEGQPKRRFLQLRGLEDPLLSAAVHAIDLHDDGLWFSNVGVERRDQNGDGKPEDLIQAVIGEGLAGELGRDRNADEMATARNPERLTEGDTFELRDRQWLVVGVMKSAGTTFDSEVWAKQSLVGPMFGKDRFSTLVLATASDAAAKEVKNFFNNEYTKAALSAYVEQEYFESLNAVNKQFSFAFGFIAFWVAIAGIAGAMNTMFAAVSQRTKDIGVLRILGFARWQVLLSFLIESMFLAFAGGVLGCLLGSLVHGQTMTSVISSGQGGFKTVVIVLTVDSAVIARGLLLTVTMGVLGGLVPAINAMRVRPLESLR